MTNKINPSVLKGYGITDKDELEEFSRLQVDEQIAFLKQLNDKTPRESIWQKRVGLLGFIGILHILVFILIFVIRSLQ